MQTPVGLMCYRANAFGLDVLSCNRPWARCVIVQTAVGLICVIMQSPVGLMCYHANAWGLDV